MEAIIISSILVISLFLLYYLRTKKLLYKLADIQKKDYQAMLTYIAKIESRCAKPLEDFKLTDKLDHWVIVISYNRPELIHTTITSIKANEPNIKVLVIDNGSDTKTIDTLIKLKQELMINKLVLNHHKEVPQWQKSFAISQALKLLNLESVATITIADNDIQVLKPWIHDAMEIYRNFSDTKLICLMIDQEQNAVHPTEEVRHLNDEEILIKSSFNGAFFMLRLQDLMELGYPPINEGISDESVEDWYYTRQLKVRNWKVATINRCLHLGYNTSIRESL